MPVEDRTIDTSALRRAVADGDGWLQLADGLLDRLDPLGVHVVLPAGKIAHDGDDLVLVELLLCTSDGSGEEPARVRVPMPLDRFLALPTAYVTIARFQELVAATGDVVELWLAHEDGASVEDGDDA